MPVIEILNPQTPIPDVKSKFTIINGREESIDLNEDSWATEYFVLFFHTGPQDPVATSILRSVDKKNDTGPDQLTCKVVGISMNTTQALFDWLDFNPDLKDFDVPLMSDKTADIGRQFGVLQQAAGQDQTGAGFPANSVFIIDGMDRVRYHCVLDSRVAFNVGEIARLVRAFQETDGAKGLAMANCKGKEDIVINKISHIKHFYGTKFGGGKHTCEDCPKEVTEDKADDGSGKPNGKDTTNLASTSPGGDGGKASGINEKTNGKKDLVKQDNKEDEKATTEEDTGRRTTKDDEKSHHGFLSGLSQKMKNIWPGGKKEN